MYEKRTQGTDDPSTTVGELVRYIYSDHLGSSSLELDEDGEIISYEEYHPYGTTAYQAKSSNINAIAKRYRYTGKERDEETGLYYHGARYYIPWLCRWSSIDPILSEWYNMVKGQPDRTQKRDFIELCASPYEYAYDNPVRFNDPSGEQPPSPHIAFPFIVPRRSNSPLSTMHRDVVSKAKDFSESRAGIFVGGAINTTFGTVGAISSLVYIMDTMGAGAAVGGAISLQLSFAEMSIGIAQMANAFSIKPHQTLQNASTAPGLIAYSAGSKYAGIIDAGSAFSPTAFTSGKFTKLFTFENTIKGGLGILGATDVLKSDNIRNGVFKLLELTDQLLDSKAFILESFTLTTERQTENSGIQTFSYSGNYTVQKGDNLATIADKFDITVDSLVKQNNLDSPDNLQIGDKLQINSTITDKIYINR